MFPNGDYRSVDFSESFEHRVSSEDPFFFFFFFLRECYRLWSCLYLSNYSNCSNFVGNLSRRYFSTMVIIMDVTSSINGFIRTNVISSMALRCHLVALTTSKLIMAASLPLPRAWLRRGRTATNISSHWLVTLYRSSIPFVDVNLCFAKSLFCSLDRFTTIQVWKKSMPILWNERKRENLRGGKFLSCYISLIGRFRRRWQHGSTHSRVDKATILFYRRLNRYT